MLSKFKFLKKDPVLLSYKFSSEVW